MRKSMRIWQVAGLSIAGLVATLVAFFSYQDWLARGGIFETADFDEAEWKSMRKGTADSSCYRGGMAEDIRKSVLRAGQTKADVERRLGLPDAVSPDVHEYVLGMCSGLRIDFDTLDVHFDSVGRLVSVQVVQH